MDRAHSPINSILEQAAHLVRREKETAGNVEQAESYKRGQIEKLKQFASSYHLWIDINTQPITFLSKGGENKVYTRDKNSDKG